MAWGILGVNMSEPTPAAEPIPQSSATPPEQPNNLTSKIRDGLLTTVATAIVSGIGATLLAVWGLVVTLPGKIGLTPSGAIMAFDLADGCPAGWQDYDKGRGRFLVGAGSQQEMQQKIPGNFVRDARGVDLTAKAFGQPGGEEKHLVLKDNIPPIFLTFHSQLSGNGLTVSTIEALTFDPPTSGLHVETSKVPAKPIDIMPPYVALYFCKKT
jgi:hypothetical protein